ncbi:MAG: hypothetical protein KAU14_08345, partial [Thermoplasmata archaeon]|nr:hypothetical protein [Thermoplasmata archaeon]
MVKKTRTETTPSGLSLSREPGDENPTRTPEPTGRMMQNFQSIIDLTRGIVKTARAEYGEFIGKGRQRLGFYHPGVRERDRFLMSFLIYLMVFLIAGLRAPRVVMENVLKTARKKYDEFIEKGKQKLGFYKPEVSDSDRFLMSFL